MRQVRTIRPNRSVYGGMNARDRHMPINEDYEKGIHVGPSVVYIAEVGTPGAIREHLPTGLQERKQYTKVYMDELIDRDADLGNILGDIYLMTYMVVVSGASITEVAKEIGVSTTTVYNKVYGRSKSAYSKLKYWVSRV